MDHERLAGFDGRADMNAKAVALPFRRILLPVVVEPRLADGDHLRVLRQRHQIGDRWLLNIGRLGMYADRSKNTRIRFSDFPNPRKILERDTDAYCASNVIVLHQFKDLGELGCQVGKIQMAMRVDKHQGQFREEITSCESGGSIA